MADGNSRQRPQIPESVASIILEHQATLWKVSGIFSCASIAADQQGWSEGDVQYALEGALELLKPLLEQFEPVAICLDAAKLESADQQEVAA